MNKTQKITLLLSVIIGLGVLSGAFIIAKNKKDLVSNQPTPTAATRPISSAELAKADGRDGRECYIAVDGTVYIVKDFSLWQDGQHTSSNGLAYCGADLSKVIDQAPHGRKMLDILPKVGPLER